MADSDFTLPRKRRRPAKSCEQCRRRKIRCDQNLPCASCIRTRASLQCSYRTESADTSNASADTDQGALEPAQSSVLTPESWSEAVQHGAQADTIAARQDKTIRDLRRQVQQLQAQLSSSRHHQPPTPSDTTTGPSAQFQPLHRISEASAQFSQAPDACIPAVTPKLRTASDKTKLFGQSHWLHSAEKVWRCEHIHAGLYAYSKPFTDVMAIQPVRCSGHCMPGPSVDHAVPAVGRRV